MGKFLLGAVSGGAMVIGALVVGSALFPPRPAGEGASTATSAEVPAAESTVALAEPEDGDAAVAAPDGVTIEPVEPASEGASLTPEPEATPTEATPTEAAPAEPLEAAEAPAAEVAAVAEPALAEPVPEAVVPETEAPAAAEAVTASEAPAAEVATEAASAEPAEAPPVNPGAIAALLEDAPPVPPRQLDRSAVAVEAEPEAAPVEAALPETDAIEATPEMAAEMAPETAPALAELAEAAPAEAAAAPLVPLIILPAPTLQAAEPAATGPEVALSETLPEPTPPAAASEPPVPPVAETPAEAAPAPETAIVEEATPETGAAQDLPQVAVIEPEPEVAPDPMAVPVPEAASLPGTQAATMPGTRPDALPGTTLAVIPDTGAAEPPATEVTEGVVTNRLPRIGGDAAPETEAESQAEAEPAPQADTRPLALYASDFENPDGKPLMAIVLVDTGTDSLDRETLAALPFPVSIALDPMDPATPDRAALYRSAGKEVVMLATGLAEGAQASDIEVAFQAMAQGLPEAVAVMDLADPAFQDNRPLASLVVPVVQGEGRGLLTWDRGLNAADQVARREGVPAATVFRDITPAAGDKFGMRRLLDRAMFKADQDGRVTVVGDASGELAATLLEWTLEGRGATVALAPLTAVLTTN